MDFGVVDIGLTQLRVISKFDMVIVSVRVEVVRGLLASKVARACWPGFEVAKPLRYCDN